MARAHDRRRHRAVELTMRRRTLLLAAPAAVAPAVIARVASAQTTLPDKGLRIVVGFVNNGGADLMARLLRLDRGSAGRS
jgi:tripartite-type tricarboxylate transporter receptor subunit TctC